MAYRKKKSQAHQNSDTAFKNLWTASSKLNQYDSLYDHHTQYYFASPSVQQHLHHLSKTIKRNPFSTLNRRKKSGLLSLTKSITEKRRIISKEMKGKDSHIEIKIQPYSHDLRDSSTFKLQEFKENLKANRKLKKDDHNKFIEANKSRVKPQSAKIKVVRTLAPIKTIK